MIMGENKMMGFDLKASWLGHVTPEMYFEHTFKVPLHGFEDEEETMNIGGVLRELRIRNNFTQKQIADYLGITQSLVSKIEHNTRNINMTWLEQLCDLYNIQDYDLLDGLTDYQPLKIQGDCSDLNAISKMNQVRKDLELLRRLEE